MHPAQKVWTACKQLSPFSLSLCIHTLILILFSFITLHLPPQPEDEETPATIVLHGTQEDRLRFQDKNHLDRFKVDDHMVYPLPEIEYSPVLPDVTFYPEPQIREELNLIGIEAVNRTVLSPSTGRQPLYTGEEKLAGSFTRHIQILREGGLDIVFVFDSTSSMAQFLRQVKHKIANMIATFKNLVPTARIGVVTYRDVGEDFITRVHHLTHGTRNLQDFLRDIDPVGGGDREEAVDEALRVAIEEFSWRKKSKKIILVIGDAPPHAQDMQKTLTLIKNFRENMHGVVSALDTSYESSVMLSEDFSGDGRKNVMEEFRLFAETGGGESARLIDEEKVIRQMVVLVFGTRWEVSLDEFLKHL